MLDRFDSSFRFRTIGTRANPTRKFPAGGGHPKNCPYYWSFFEPVQKVGKEVLSKQTTYTRSTEQSCCTIVSHTNTSFLCWISWSGVAYPSLSQLSVSSPVPYASNFLESYDNGVADRFKEIGK